MFYKWHQGNILGKTLGNYSIFKKVHSKVLAALLDSILWAADMNLKNPEVALIGLWIISKVLGASSPDIIKTNSVRGAQSPLRLLKVKVLFAQLCLSATPGTVAL